jgi:hypothetical protein
MSGALTSEIQEAHFHVCQWLAGIEAERLFCNELLPNTAHDILAARAVAGLIVRDVSDVDAYIDFARSETRALLCNHAASVLAIAAALVERRTIVGNEIDGIIAASLSGPDAATDH